MSKIDVIEFFNKHNYEVNIIELGDIATVEKAAEALNVKTNDIAKTLAFYVNDKTIVIIMSGDARVSNKKYKKYFGVKAKMIPFDEVLEATGHPAGGVCPFGVKENVNIYIDESLRDLKEVYPAAGSTNTALKIKPSNIQELTNAIWINISE